MLEKLVAGVCIAFVVFILVIVIAALFTTEDDY
jgi:hypothetical protein